MELRDYVSFIRRQLRPIVGCLLLGLAAGALFTLLATPQYTSTARMFVSTAQSDTFDAYQGGLFSQQRVTSYAELVGDEEIAQRVVDKLQLNESAKSLSRRINATVVPQTVILDVTVTDPVPSRAQTLAAAVTEEFTSFVQELETPPGKTRATIKVSIVVAADLPTSPVSPQPGRNLALAGVLGLLAGVVAAVLREALRAPDEISSETDDPALDGNAPTTPDHSAPRSAGRRRPPPGPRPEMPG